MEKIVRASAVFDALVMLPFAIPGLVGVYLNLLKTVHQNLGFSGSIPEFTPLHFMFMNLFGAIVVFWSILRFSEPDGKIIRADIIARFVFAALMSFYYFTYGVTAIVVALIGTELFWALLLLYGLRKAATR